MPCAIMGADKGKLHFTDIHQAIKAGNQAKAHELVQGAFDDQSVTEPELAQICDVIFYTQSETLYDFLGEFIQRYPISVFAAKAIYANLLATKGHVDVATEFAREHLRALRDRGALNKIKSAPPLVDGATRAFLAVTAAYTVAGAISYATRVLKVAVETFQNSEAAPSGGPSLPDPLKAFERQLSSLANEKAKPESQSRDALWEEFFKTGKNADELVAHCRTLKLEQLAKRIELIADNLKHDANFKADQNELFLLVRQARRKQEDGAKGEVVEILI